MHEINKDKAIIIERLCINDSDIIIKVISENYGKTSFIAKNSRNSKKRFPGGLDIFDAGHIVYQSHNKISTFQNKSKLKSITQFNNFFSPKNFSTSSSKLAFGSFIAECFDHLIYEENEKGTDFFNFFLNSIKSVDQSSDNSELFNNVSNSIANLLKISGFYSLDLENVHESVDILKLVEMIQDITNKEIKSFNLIKKLKLLI